MGRKALFDEKKEKKGPGKKAKKQKDPTFPFPLDNARDKALTHRQKQRAFKRQKVKDQLKEKQAQKKAELLKNKNKPPKKKALVKKKALEYNSDTSDEESEDVEEEEGEVESSKGFSDDNKEWLKPKGKKRKAEDSDDQEGSDDDEDESDAEGSDASIEEEEEEVEEESGDEEETDEKNGLKVGTLDDISDDELDDEMADEEAEDEESEGSDDESEGSDEEDEEDLLPVEKAARKLKKKQQKEREEAEEEMQLNIADREIFCFPKEGEMEKPIGIPETEQRIKDNLMVLSNFKKFRDTERSRAEYLELLKTDLCNYFSYNRFLIDRFIELFPLTDLMDFLEASEIQRPLTIRVNSLKTRRRDVAQALIARGVNLDPVGKWSKVGLVIYTSPVPVGATPEYLAGHYIIQGASSMLPVMALAPQEGEKILDLCAAPGGKASHIAAIMKNTGVLFANDSSKERAKAIVGNFHRMGIINSVICSYDGRKFSQVMKGFDRVLVDAPCTGTGVISKDPSVKINKDQVDVQRCVTLQKELILEAIDCVNFKSSTGGYIVYSTCSILPEENEWVVDFALKNRDVKLVETGLDFGTPGFTNYRNFRFHPSLNLTRRFYPHTHNMDGFFVAKFKKLSNKMPNKTQNEKNEDENGTDVESEDSEKEIVKKPKIKAPKHGRGKNRAKMLENNETQENQIDSTAPKFKNKKKINKNSTNSGSPKNNQQFKKNKNAQQTIKNAQQTNKNAQQTNKNAQQTNKNAPQTNKNAQQTNINAQQTNKNSSKKKPNADSSPGQQKNELSKKKLDNSNTQKPSNQLKSSKNAESPKKKPKLDSSTMSGSTTEKKSTKITEESKSNKSGLKNKMNLNSQRKSLASSMKQSPKKKKKSHNSTL